MKERQQSDPVPLVDLLEAAAVGTPGQLVDMSHKRGWAVLVDSVGRLALAPGIADQLRAEQAERERVAAEEFERAEKARLERLAAYAEEQEAVALQQAREQEARARQRRLEMAVGIPLWMLEQQIRRSRTSAPGVGMSYDQRQIEDNKPITIEEAEQYIVETYGPEVLEGGKR